MAESRDFPIEKFRMKDGFIKRLHLSSDVEEAILDYHVKKHNLDDFDGVNSSRVRGLLDTYSELLLVARTPYHPDDLVPVIQRMQEKQSFYYAVGCTPQGLGGHAWECLCEAFLDCGYLRPISRDDRCFVWPEIDFVFKQILNEYADYNVAMSGEFAIGCFNPRNHEEYESFSRVFSYEDIVRIVRYFHVEFSTGHANDADCLLNNQSSGAFVQSIFSPKDPRFRRELGRTDVIKNINRIYYGEKVTIEIF